MNPSDAASGSALPGPDRQAPGRTSGEIQQWMVTYLARQLQVEPEAIDVSLPFYEFSLDSATAIGMTGELEEWLGRRIDVTMVYEYPTIEGLARYLAGEA
jgi:acyl carrier protein